LTQDLFIYEVLQHPDDIAGDDLARGFVSASELVYHSVNVALAVDQAQDLDCLLVRQQQPLGREYDPGFAHPVEAEFCMCGKSKNRAPA
jgi:hypothetical protein